MQSRRGRQRRRRHMHCFDKCTDTFRQHDHSCLERDVSPDSCRAVLGKELYFTCVLPPKLSDSLGFDD